MANQGIPLIEMSSIPAYIRHLRKQRKMTQTEVADQLGVNASTYARWEKGRRQPPFRKLSILFSEVFKVEAYNINQLSQKGRAELFSEVVYWIESRPKLRDVLETVKDWDDNSLEDLLTWCSGYSKGMEREKSNQTAES